MGTKFAKLELRMVYSEAYQDLNAPTLKMLSYVLLQLKWKNTSRGRKANWVCTNKDEIELLYATFKKSPFNMSDKTVTRAIDSLLAHGFVSVESQGGMCKGHKSLFSYSEKWKDWKPGNEPIETRVPFRKRGFQNK